MIHFANKLVLSLLVKDKDSLEGVGLVLKYHGILDKEQSIAPEHPR